LKKVETNIVIFYLNEEIQEADFLKHLKDNGIIISSMGEGKLRIVTHLDYTQEMHEEFKQVLENLS